MRMVAQVVVLTGSLAASLFAGPQTQSAKAVKTSVAQQLQGQFVLTKFSGFELKKAGSVLVVQKDGMGAVPGFGAAFLTSTFGNNYKDGRIRHDRLSELVQGRMEGLRNLWVGEGVYVLKIQVTDSSVVLDVQACGACNPSAMEPYPVRSTVTFPFRKGFLDNTTVEQIRQTISEVFAFANPDPATQPVPQAPPPVTEAAPPTPPSPPPLLPPVEPAKEPAKIELGQTIDQVQAILGRPDKVVDLGGKKIYLYKDLKIIFQDGLVADVQ